MGRPPSPHNGPYWFKQTMYEKMHNELINQLRLLASTCGGAPPCAPTCHWANLSGLKLV